MAGPTQRATKVLQQERDCERTRLEGQILAAVYALVTPIRRRPLPDTAERRSTATRPQRQAGGSEACGSPTSTGGRPLTRAFLQISRRRPVPAPARSRPSRSGSPAILVSAELFAAVAEQLSENRRRQRQGARGARYLLQGLLVCKRCGYACYGKPVSPRAAKGKQRRAA
jgi:hypothetical protein